jgi:hypothetical protein
MAAQKARKVTISLDADVIDWVKRHARREHGGNVSASVADCVEAMRRREHLRNFLRMSGAPALSADEVAELLTEIRGDQRAAKVTRRGKRHAA